MASKPSKLQDLDLDAVITTERHDKDFGDLDKRLQPLEAKFATHEQIADTLCVTAEKAVKMQEMLTSHVIKLIQNDDKIKEAITVLINKSDRNWFYAYLKRIGVVVSSLSLLVLGAIAKTLSDRFLHS